MTEPTCTTERSEGCNGRCGWGLLCCQLPEAPASELDEWVSAHGVQTLSVKRYAGSWHAVAVVDGETVSTQGDTPSSALGLLVLAVDELDGK